MYVYVSPRIAVGVSNTMTAPTPHCGLCPQNHEPVFFLKLLCLLILSF